jgi:hypothetical protein
VDGGTSLVSTTTKSSSSMMEIDVLWRKKERASRVGECGFYGSAVQPTQSTLALSLHGALTTDNSFLSHHKMPLIAAYLEPLV